MYIRFIIILVYFFGVRLATAEPLKHPLKLGVVVPLTGPAALMGESLTGVIKLAKLNNIAPLMEDDRCEGKGALAAYRKLKLEGVKLFFMACSGSILAVAPIAKKNGDIILTTYSGSTRIRETGSEVLRFNPDAISIADGLSQLLSPELKPVVLLHEEQDYAQSLADRLTQLIGPDIAEKISYKSDASSFSSEILRIKQRKPRSIVFLPTADGPARTLLKELSQLEISLPIIGEVNLCDFPFRPSDWGLHGRCLSARFSGKEYEKFLQIYSEVVGRPPAFPFYDAMAFDVLLKLDGIVALKNTIEEIKAVFLSGFTGRFASYTLSSEGKAIDNNDYLATINY